MQFMRQHLKLFINHAIIYRTKIKQVTDNLCPTLKDDSNLILD